MFRKTQLINKILARPHRQTHFEQMVVIDAVWMLERLQESKPGAIDLCKTERDLLLLLLDGCRDWEEYAAKGKACKSDDEIALRYLPEKQYMEWAVKRSKWRGFPLWKMQVDALYAASDYVLSAFRELLEEEEEAYNNTINKRWCLYEHEK